MTLRAATRHALIPLVFVLAACGTPQADASPTPPPAETPGETHAEIPEVRLEPVASGLEQPTSVGHAGDGSERLFVTEKTGFVRVIENGTPLNAPYLNLSNAVSAGNEQGLLGLAFHPQYADNGRFFVNYTRADGSTVVSEFRVSDDPNVANPGSERVLLTVAQPYANHNGGHLAFGPDGFLYIGLGDGGAGGDPEERAQNLGTLLGKMLRIGVDGAEPYAVPQDNPFVGVDGAEPEIWAYGLRNPWKYSFDRETGDLWIGDVGQNSFEEIDKQPAGSAGGENYGWDITEGSSCYSDDGSVSTCDKDGLTLPVTEYGRDEGTSVTGGYVYRGEAVPALSGQYVFGDFGSGRVWRLVAGENGLYSRETLLEAGFPVATFGEDEAGELYVADFNGAVYRLAPAAQANR